MAMIEKFFGYLFFVAILAILMLTACRGTDGNTQYSIETESYKLGAQGQWLANGSQSYDVIVDSFHRINDDTVRLLNDVATVAVNINNLSDGIGCQPGAHYLAKGSYELNLELVHKPGSDHAANFRAALGNLRDWGYITIDTILWKRVAIVRNGTIVIDSLNTYHFLCKPYNLCMSKELYDDNASFGVWLSEWSNLSQRTPEELFNYLNKIGYDTIQQADYIQIEPKVCRPYMNR